MRHRLARIHRFKLSTGSDSGSTSGGQATNNRISYRTEILQGDVQDFRGIAVDLEGVAPFARQVYEAAREIPAGQTRTYGEIAKSIGQPAAAQEVGQALSKNPVPIIVPCHRVSAAGGKLGGFSAPGGPTTKARLLALEGAPVSLPLFP